jgi:lipid-A-disaccharide synthase
MAMTFFMLAGEASGDQHASRLISALKKQEPSARFVGMGGPKMAAEGLEVAKDLEGMQVVGFWEVAKKYGFFRDVFYKLLDRVKQERPAALICVDYPGFNLRFAKEVRKLGIPVLYYIVPQVWAWKPMRAKKMAEFVDRAYCVFEFELPFFTKFGLKTEFVGHPLVDREPNDCGSRIADCGLKLPPGPKTVAFLPGSRATEIAAHFPTMAAGYSLVNTKYGFRKLISLPPNWPVFSDEKVVLVWEQDQRLPRRYIFGTLPSKNLPEWHDIDKIPYRIAESAKYVAVSHSTLLPSLADFSVVKSGTSTLESGLVGNPMCVIYKAGAISYTIARTLVNIPVFSLVNIVLGRYAVPELLQSDVTPQRIALEIERGLTDEKYREQQKAALAELPKKLGGSGASARAAKGMLDFLRGK